MEEHHRSTLSPMRGFQSFQGLDGIQLEIDQNPSLSEYHDYEPSLEFDDSELAQANGLVQPPSILPENSDDLLNRPSSDGTIEENFEEELATAPEVYTEIASGSFGDEFTDLSGTGLIEVVGDDDIGRRIITVFACRLPPTKDIHPDRLLRFFMFTLDKYVEQDYSLVYFPFGLTKNQQPPLSWFWNAYHAFDRKYKKNLKALYIVHPTKLIRLLCIFLKPVISAKFSTKMIYVNYVHELSQYLNLDKLCIPQRVLDFDRLLLAKNPKAIKMARQLLEKAGLSYPTQTLPGPSHSLSPPPTQQFGVSLQFIKANNPKMVNSIPPVVRTCVEFLSKPDAIETEGIFRRSAKISVIKELQTACNRGEPIDFRNDPHNAAVLLKTFLKDLEEPLMTFELQDEIVKFPTWSAQQRARLVKILVLEKLPLDNYKLLKYIFKFLWQVQDRSCMNKMTSSNLSVVFGPNLSWPTNGHVSLFSISHINAFTNFLIENQESIFII